MPERYRQLRIIEYYGTREQIDEAITNRSVKGSKTLPNGLRIIEAMLGEIPIIVEDEIVLTKEEADAAGYSR